MWPEMIMKGKEPTHPYLEAQNTRCIETNVRISYIHIQYMDASACTYVCCTYIHDVRVPKETTYTPRPYILRGRIQETIIRAITSVSETPGRIQQVDPQILDSNTPMV